MDEASSESRKRLAEDERSPERSAASLSPLCRQQDIPYQLAGKLDNISLFRMAVVHQVNGPRVMVRSVVSLLIDAIRSRPKTWHASWLIAEQQLQDFLSQEEPIEFCMVYFRIFDALDELDMDLANIQKISIKRFEESTDDWWSRNDTADLAIRLKDLSNLDDTVLDQGPVNMRLSRVVQEIMRLNGLGPNAVGKDTFWNPPMEDDVFRTSDKAASALRYQMLRLLLLYEKHNDYLQFFKKIVHDLRSVVDEE